MGLIAPPFYFARQTDNLSGNPSANGGTTFSAGANDADGTAVQLLSALAHDVCNLVIGFAGLNAGAGEEGNSLADILIDPAGGTSWTPLINDLVCGANPSTGAGVNCYGQWYHFPLRVPAGTSIGVRARTARATNLTNGRCIIYAQGCPSRPDRWWCGQGVETLGADPAQSLGTVITSGNSGAFGSWVSIGSASTRRFGAVQFGLNAIHSNLTANSYHFELGYGSTRLPGSPTFHVSNSVDEVLTKNCSMPIPCNVAAGTQWQIRGKCSGTDQQCNGAVYGVY